MTPALPSTIEVREFGTASLFAMLVLSVVFFSIYLRYEWLDVPASSRRWFKFDNDENRAAGAWLLTCFGAALRNLGILISIHAENHGYTISSPVLSGIYASGTFIALIGMICLMRSLSRYQWPRAVWMIMMLGVFSFAFAFLLAR